ncbi:uncharacterized protein GGS25DRAFT_523059 [Hypoxylon fragiforme]|uniref:uncharacterized protein n=1 Tax=Hypoxylon fragiforme TaxID=63214 RepID=UPI0020C73442|nr:uncharacterized protein GGS25DRAFT_523059 [Hypoxylon fragiforme]KAI2607536.1 hypothetical protein GGS25DRAFT_523059 [Hypoxylon fragiforme]
MPDTPILVLLLADLTTQSYQSNTIRARPIVLAMSISLKEAAESSTRTKSHSFTFFGTLVLFIRSATQPQNRNLEMTEQIGITARSN